MRVPKKEIVRRTMKRLEPIIAQIVKGAWQDWMEINAETVFGFPRTRANIVWDRVIHRANEKFLDDSSIKIIRHHQTVSFVVDDQVLFRFKKADANGISRNFPTQLGAALFKRLDHAASESGTGRVVNFDV